MSVRLLHTCFFVTILLTNANAACLDISVGAAPVQLSGKLTREVFPGRPNYESIESGDEPEPAWILVLDASICADDEGELADPNIHFDKVHLYSTEESIRTVLAKALGNRVAVSGEGFFSHTGHHHAPLVVNVAAISAQ
ncbi:MAG: DUF4431 domain-containing protein [Rhizobiales bacterium]|nr:DUF4431 domain-containing protein [Hyphomicrobiales bacterium]